MVVSLMQMVQDYRISVPKVVTVVQQLGMLTQTVILVILVTSSVIEETTTVVG